MLISEVMTNTCTTCDRHTNLEDAAKIMREEDIGILPIEDNDRLIGVITDRDIVVRSVAKNKLPRKTQVDELLADKDHHCVYYCFDDQLCDEVATNMAKLQVRRLPVVNRDKRLVGIITIGDLASRGAAAKAKKALEGVSADLKQRD